MIIDLSQPYVQQVKDETHKIQEVLPEPTRRLPLCNVVMRRIDLV
jgi:hypothetical protein